MLPAIFNNQPIRQERLNGQIWISLTDCAKAAGMAKQTFSHMLKDASTLAYCEELNKSKSQPLDLLKINKGNNFSDALGRGTWLDITEAEGKSLLLYFAQRMSPAFHIWCNAHLINLLTDGYAISDNISLAQLAKAEAKIDKLQIERGLLKKTIKRQQRDFTRLLPAHLEQKELKASVLSEQDLSNAMHLLFSRLCKAYYAEYAINTEFGLARFDSIRRAPQFTEIIEFKKGWINYKVADKELFGEQKRYFDKIRSHFGTKPIIFTFMSPCIDDISMSEFVAEKQYLFGDLFRIEFCQLDKAYFLSLKSAYVRQCLARGLSFSQAEETWLLCGNEQIVQNILALGAQHHA